MHTGSQSSPFAAVCSWLNAWLSWVWNLLLPGSGDTQVLGTHKFWGRTSPGDKVGWLASYLSQNFLPLRHIICPCQFRINYFHRWSAVPQLLKIRERKKSLNMNVRDLRKQRFILTGSSITRMGYQIRLQHQRNINWTELNWTSLG